MTNKYLFNNNQLKMAIIYYIKNNIDSNNLWNEIKKNVEWDATHNPDGSEK